MSVQMWTYVFVFLSFSLYIGIAIWSRAGSTKEFYVAGGGVHPLANGLLRIKLAGQIGKYGLKTIFILVFIF